LGRPISSRIAGCILNYERIIILAQSYLSETSTCANTAGTGTLTSRSRDLLRGQNKAVKNLNKSPRITHDLLASVQRLPCDDTNVLFKSSRCPRFRGPIFTKSWSSTTTRV